MQGTSHTAGVLVTVPRAFAVHVQALSATPTSLIQHLRLLEGAVVETSVTPDSLHVLVRRLVSGLTASSVTDVSAHALVRTLLARLLGLSQASAIRVTTARPLEAVLVGTSSTSPSLFVPNSGEMLLQATSSGAVPRRAGGWSFCPVAALARSDPGRAW